MPIRCAKNYAILIQLVQENDCYDFQCVNVVCLIELGQVQALFV